MEGKKIISNRQLINLIMDKGEIKLLAFNIGCNSFGILNAKLHNGQLFGATNNRLYLERVPSHLEKHLLGASNGSFVYALRDFGVGSMYNYIIVPDDFDNQLKEFATQNKSVLGKWYNVINNPNDDFYGLGCYAYLLTHKSPHLTLWFLQNHAVYMVQTAKLTHICNWAVNNPNSVKMLTKHSLSAYNRNEMVDKLYDEIRHLKKVNTSKVVINSFNTAQKKLLKSQTLSDSDITIFTKFMRQSEVKRTNFIRKMSTVYDTDEIMNQMSVFVKDHFDWGRDALLGFIETNKDLDCEIVWDKDNIIIVQTNNYDSIKYLAKSTNWCISKNKTYWNNYMCDECANPSTNIKQYVMFDFNQMPDSEYSIVGFTIKKNVGITASHSFTNANICNDKLSQYTKCFNNINTIHRMLKCYGIPYERFIFDADTSSGMPLKCAFNKESILKIITSSPNNNSCEILRSDTRLVAHIQSLDIVSSLLNLPKDFHPHTHDMWLFCDFNESEYQKDDCVAIFTSNEHEAYYPIYMIKILLNNAYNSTAYMPFFEGYDILTRTLFLYDLSDELVYKRKPNKMRLLTFTLSNKDIRFIDKLLQDEPLKKHIVTCNRNRTTEMQYIQHYVTTSVLSDKALDIIELFCNNGISVSNILTLDGYRYLISETFSLLQRITHQFQCTYIQDLDEIFKQSTNMPISSHSIMANGLLQALNIILKGGQIEKIQDEILHSIKGVLRSPITEFSSVCLDMLVNALTQSVKTSQTFINEMQPQINRVMCESLVKCEN